MQAAPALESPQHFDIIVVDDSPDDLLWLSRLARNISEYSTVHCVQDSARLESLLLDYKTSIVFVDHFLGEHTGIEVIQQFHRHFPDVAQSIR